MGYRSQVHALIYGPEEKICALVAKHELQDGKLFTDEMFGDSIRRFKTVVQRFDPVATAAGSPNEHGGKPVVYCDVPLEVIELRGDDWKWYEDYEDVKAWHKFMEEDTEEYGLSWEFVRIGEEASDIEVRNHTPVDDWYDTFLSVSSSIHSELLEPEDEGAFVKELNNG